MPSTLTRMSKFGRYGGDIDDEKLASLRMATILRFKMETSLKVAGF